MPVARARRIALHRALEPTHARECARTRALTLISASSYGSRPNLTASRATHSSTPLLHSNEGTHARPSALVRVAIKAVRVRQSFPQTRTRRKRQCTPPAQSRRGSDARMSEDASYSAAAHCHASSPDRRLGVRERDSCRTHLDVVHIAPRFWRLVLRVGELKKRARCEELELHVEGIPCH